MSCQSLNEVCTKALLSLERLSQLTGREKLSSTKAASMIREAVLELQPAIGECIRGCGENGEARCILGSLMDRFVSTVYGLTVRLERLGDMGGRELGLFEILVDLLYSLVETFCKVGEEV